MVYWAAHHELPQSKYQDIEELAGALDVQALKAFASNGKDYTSSVFVSEVLALLGQNVIERVLNQIRSDNCTSFSLLSDETTDVENVRQLIIHARYIHGTFCVTHGFAVKSLCTLPNACVLSNFIVVLV